MGKIVFILELMILGGWWYLTSLVGMPHLFFLDVNDPTHLVGVLAMLVLGLIVPDDKFAELA